MTVGESVSMRPATHAHELEIVNVIRETSDAVSLVFDPPEQKVSAFRYHAGQFLTLKIPSDRAESVARCYSLSSSPHLDDNLIVTVKRTAGGYASNWLCDNAAPGMRLTVLSPSGSFFPRTLEQDFVLLGAGSGITPLISIAKSALIGGFGSVHLVYANRDAQSVIFADELDEIAMEFPDRFSVTHWWEADRGLPRESSLVDLLGGGGGEGSGGEVYVCGPKGFMECAQRAARILGVDPAHIHTERYRSLSGDPFADVEVAIANADDDAHARVTLHGQRVDVEWPRDATLLDVLLASGYDAPYSCRAGECSSCACTVRAGEVRMLKNDTLVDSDLRLGLTLACQAVPVSDSVDIVFDQ